MDHEKIKQDELVERYVLGKLSADEERLFEAHYFDCNECFQEVRETEMIFSALKQDVDGNELSLSDLSKGPRFTLPDWLVSLASSPKIALAASVLCLLLLYPSWLGIRMVPELNTTIEELGKPQANVRNLSLQVTRGNGQTPAPTIELGKDERVFILTFNILEKTVTNPKYEGRILDEGNAEIWKSDRMAGTGDYEVFTIACTRSFLKGGSYTLKVREIDAKSGEEGKEFSFPFSVTMKAEGAP